MTNLRDEVKNLVFKMDLHGKGEIVNAEKKITDLIQSRERRARIAGMQFMDERPVEALEELAALSKEKGDDGE